MKPDHICRKKDLLFDTTLKKLVCAYCGKTYTKKESKVLN